VKLDYKILWLDDKIHEFIDDEFVNEIKEHLVEEEFNPIIDTTDNQEEFNEFLDDSYDLILTDFHLNETGDKNQVNGDTIVNEIRETNVFTEILFYTAKADLEGSLSWDRISFLQTEHLPDDHHEEVIKKVKFLIDLTVKKFQDIIVMRGMIMHETSLLDEQKLDILKKYIADNRNIEQIKLLKTSLLSDLTEHFNEKSNKIEKCKNSDKMMKNIIKDNVLFTASYKIQALEFILNILGQDDFSNDYKEEIIGIRNKFAHVELLEDESGRRYFKGKDGGITFDDVLCKKIRKNITKC
jgi:hypothetical protein